MKPPSRGLKRTVVNAKPASEEADESELSDHVKPPSRPHKERQVVDTKPVLASEQAVLEKAQAMFAQQLQVALAAQRQQLQEELRQELAKKLAESKLESRKPAATVMCSLPIFLE